MEDLGHGLRWGIGLSSALANCFLSSAGLTLQRYSALKETAEKESAQNVSTETSSHDEPLQGKRCRRCRFQFLGTRYQRLWWLGVFLYVVAAAPDVLSYMLIPQVVCCAVACFRVVVVTVMSCFFLGERLNKWQTLGMLACTIGTLLCVSFGPIHVHGADIKSCFGQPQVRIYLIIAGSLLVFLLALDHLDTFSSRCVLGVKVRTFTLPLCTGLGYAGSKVFNTEIGFMSVPHNIFTEPAWLLMAIAVALLGLLDLFLNLRGVRLMAVSVFVPVAFVWTISLQYFQSVALFSELEGLDAVHISLSIAGACLSLCGAIALQLPTKSAEQDDKQREGSVVGLDLPDRCSPHQDHKSSALLEAS